MNEIELINQSLKEKIGVFLFGLQTEKKFSEMSFGEIDKLSEEIAFHLRYKPEVPKSLLNELRTFIKVLRAEAPYMKDKSSVVNKMADKIEMTFDLILCGETSDDRRPGVPRII